MGRSTLRLVGVRLEHKRWQVVCMHCCPAVRQQRLPMLLSFVEPMLPAQLCVCKDRQACMQ